MHVCGVAVMVSAITMSDFTTATKIIRKRKMTLCWAWMKDLESYCSFTRKLLMSGYVEGEIDLRDTSLDCVEVKF